MDSLYFTESVRKHSVRTGQNRQVCYNGTEQEAESTGKNRAGGYRMVQPFGSGRIVSGGPGGKSPVQGQSCIRRIRYISFIGGATGIQHHTVVWSDRPFEQKKHIRPIKPAIRHRCVRP